MSAWTGKSCIDCDKQKGPRQKHNKRCWTCQRKVNQENARQAHGKRLEETYGITIDEYDALYEFQGGRCALCRIATGKSRRLSVDHDHKCTAGHDPKLGCQDCVRGLLCRPCNNLLGVARDSIDYLLRAIRYLKTPPFQEMRRRNVS